MSIQRTDIAALFHLAEADDRERFQQRLLRISPTSPEDGVQALDTLRELDCGEDRRAAAAPRRGSGKVG